MTLTTTDKALVPTLQPCIAVDFDGTLCDHEYPGIGAVKQNAREALSLFRALGFRILIYTCRTCHWHYDVFGGDPSQPVMDRPKVQEMVEFLAANDLEYDEIDDGSRGKPLADYYIDDKGIRFEDNWLGIARFIYNRTLPKTSTAPSQETGFVLVDKTPGRILLGTGDSTK